MSHWELTYKQYPTKLAPTTEDARNIPIIFSNWFITHDQGDRVRFAQFGDEAVWNVNPNHPWIYLQTNLAVPQETLEIALPFSDQLTDLDVYTGFAKYNGKNVAWHRPMLSRTESATSRIQRIPSPSPPKAAPKLKYSHMVESTLRPHDPGKLSPDLSHVQSRDISTTLGSCDIQAHDPGKVSYDLPRDWSST